MMHVTTKGKKKKRFHMLLLNLQNKSHSQILKEYALNTGIKGKSSDEN